MSKALAYIEAQERLNFFVDPYDISWGYKLRTITTDTYGGKVVQILGVELTTLTISTVMGSGGRPELERMRSFFRSLGLWQQNKQLPATFNFPQRGYVLKFWAQSFKYEDSLDNVVFPISITGLIQEDMGGILKKSIMTEELKKLATGIGYTRNKYNDPDIGDINKLGFEAAKALAVKNATVEGSGGSGSGGSGSGGSGGSGGAPAGDFVFYQQWQAGSSWRDQTYWGGTMAGNGCQPTSVAEVVATLKDKTITPKETGAYMESISVCGQGGMMPEIFQHYGLTCKGISSVAEAVAGLKAGGIVIESGGGSAPFTSGGHYVVIRAMAPDGQQVLLGDCNAKTPTDDPSGNNGHPWPQSVMTDCERHSFNLVSKP